MDILEFILARYNYWIFITLMMTGLYIVISRGNLVKTLIGLNLFQTSVFIFYISIGKIATGTAPILIGGHEEESHGEEHGGESHGAPHETGAHPATDGPDHAGEYHGGNVPEPGHQEALHAPEGIDIPSNSLSADTMSSHPVDASHPVEMLHAAGDSIHQTQGLFTSTGAASEIADAAAQGAEIVYTNPLPHVLILTAIVVGVATTAVGLSLAVRIREAYGTIEEDELEAEDHFSEFGVPLKRGEEGAA